MTAISSPVLVSEIGPDSDWGVVHVDWCGISLFIGISQLLDSIMQNTRLQLGCDIKLQGTGNGKFSPSPPPPAPPPTSGTGIQIDRYEPEVLSLR